MPPSAAICCRLGLGYFSATKWGLKAVRTLKLLMFAIGALLLAVACAIVSVSIWLK
jgi:hypothetical protein